MISDAYTTDSIHVVLARLIQQKSQRDRVKFTASQLASALNVPRSLISRLLHPDPDRRVTNPTIETLLKIIDFFTADGFEITLDDMLGMQTKSIDVSSQNISPVTRHTVPLYSLDRSDNKIGDVDIDTSEPHDNIIAFYANRDIKPIFKKGTVFVINKNSIPENDNLIAVKLASAEHTIIRKYIDNGKEKALVAYDPSEETIYLSDELPPEFMGVITQVNAKT